MTDTWPEAERLVGDYGLWDTYPQIRDEIIGRVAAALTAIDADRGHELAADVACAEAAEARIADLEAQLDIAARHAVLQAEEIARLRESPRDVLSLIADEDTGDGKGELIRDTSRDSAPDYLPRVMQLVKILATATARSGKEMTE